MWSPVLYTSAPLQNIYPLRIFNMAEPSQQQLMETPPLDMHRIELSRKHVRALNTQFTSWVQTQLQNHPDEL
ncbi:hypothetical protein U1Q18_037744 [Sarracenia purpurea var. burkii]